MSFDDGPDLITNSWFPHQRNLIYLVKKYPVTHHTSPHNKRNAKKLKTKWDTAWIEIGSKLCQPNQTCKKLWTNIKLNYAKLMILINTGKITKEAAISHPETCRFFDGLLSFMDPLLYKITDEDIPFHIHKSINNLFGLRTTRTKKVPSEVSHTQFVTHAQVKALLKERQSHEEQNLGNRVAQYLQIIVDNAVKHKLEELLQKKDDLLNSNKSILNDDEVNTTKTVNLGLETELIIEDDIKCEGEVGINEENLTLVKKINYTADEKYGSKNILPSTKIIMPADHDTMRNNMSSFNNDMVDIACKTDDVAMKDDNEPPVSDVYIRNFFNELGVVMSLELSISKQKTLKSRINELLKDMFFERG